jgi:hypothetical protein
MAKNEKDLEVDAAIKLMDTYLRWKNSQNPPRGFKKYHPSAVGSCLRLMQYQRYADEGVMGIKPIVKEIDGKSTRIFDTGHTMHERWASYWEGIGILRGVWSCENPLCFKINDNGNINNTPVKDIYLKGKTREYGKDNIQGCLKPKKCLCGFTKFKYNEVTVDSEELNLHGHADLLLDFSELDVDKFQGIKNTFKLDNLPKGIIVSDMKTIKNERYEELLKDGPSLTYIIQLCIYANILDCEFGLLVYENKNTSEVKAYKIDRDAGGMWEEIKKQLIKLNSMAEVVDENGNKKHYLPPPRPFSKDSYECKYCDYSEICTNSDIWRSPKLPQLRKKFYGELLSIKH